MWRGIEALRRHSLPVVLKTPLTRINEDELEEDDRAHRTRRVAVRPGRDPDSSRRRRPGPSRVVSDSSGPHPLLLRDWPGSVAFRDRTGLRVASTAASAAQRSPWTLRGNVYPCPQWRKTALGNVRRTRLADLWKTSALRQETAEIARLANDAVLAAGGPMARFPFCPAVAQERTGDPVHPDALHVAQAEAAETSAARSILTRCSS